MSKYSSDYFNKTQLKKRGWTDTYIKKLLGDPDISIRNRNYGGSAKIHYYLQSRVIEAENTDDFKQWLANSMPIRTKISETHLEIHEQRRQELFDHIDNLDIVIEHMELADLHRSAVEHYNNIWREKGKVATIQDDKKFLNRISVNMLRHCSEHYETEIKNMFGKTGVDEGYDLLRKRIDSEIFRVYPDIRQ